MHILLSHPKKVIACDCARISWLITSCCPASYSYIVHINRNWSAARAAIYIFSIFVFPRQLACHKANLPANPKGLSWGLLRENHVFHLKPSATFQTSSRVGSHNLICLPFPANTWIKTIFFLTQTICKIFKLPAELAATTIFVFCPQQTLETKLPSSLPILVPEMGSEDPNAWEVIGIGRDL